MHTVELLREAINLAARLGYEVRQDWLGGAGGGACELRGRKILVLDLASGPAEQLDQVLDLLRGQPPGPGVVVSHELRGLLTLRKSA
jgi:hypothetical protein